MKLTSAKFRAGTFCFLFNDVFVLGPRSHRCEWPKRVSLQKLPSLGLICRHVRAYGTHTEFASKRGWPACVRAMNGLKIKPQGRPSPLDTHLTCCLFTRIPLPAAVAFTPISSSFRFINLQRVRCRRVLDTYVA